MEEVVEPEVLVQDEKMEEVNDEVEAEQAKPEEEGDKEEEISDEDGLFNSEFDNLIGGSEFQQEMGFGENLDWI